MRVFSALAVLALLSAPQAQATTNLVKQLRDSVLPPFKNTLGSRPLVGGFTAGSIDFSRVLSGKLPLAEALSAAQLRFLTESTKLWPLPFGLRPLGNYPPGRVTPYPRMWVAGKWCSRRWK